ncbi:MAG: hypothetical protein JNM74_11505, partial [Myxococcales bacterium]|nr:hypothetical protein [Myxococcales bacterium]
MALVDLRRLRVVSPCDAGEGDLVRGPRSAQCRLCERAVVDVAAHTQEEMGRLADEARARGERLCGELVVRSRDGAVLFADGYVVPGPTASGSRAVAFVAAASVAVLACTPAAEPVPVLVAPPPVPPSLPRAPLPVAPPPRAEVPREAVPAEPESAEEPLAEDVPIVVTPVARAHPSANAPAPPKPAPPRKKPGHEV